MLIFAGKAKPASFKKFSQATQSSFWVENLLAWTYIKEVATAFGASFPLL